MYKSVFFEISGGCNAACPYCVNGRNRILPQTSPPNRRFLSPAMLEETLTSLEEKQLISPALSLMSLYNWGEAFMHPELTEILEVLVSRGYRYSLSTNGSIYHDISERHLRYMDSIIFSLSGFSQETYSRMHGFKLEHILKNICQFTEDWCAKGVVPVRKMAFHVYQHNWQEIPKAEQFCKELEIMFLPTFASFGHFELGARFLIGTLDRKALERCMSELFTYFYWNNSRPASFRCPQFDTLSLDERGHVILCCASDPSFFPDYSFGPATELTAEQIIGRHKGSPSCKLCQEIGIDYAGHAMPPVKSSHSCG